MDSIGNCLNWKLSKFKIIKMDKFQSWEFSKCVTMQFFVQVKKKYHQKQKNEYWAGNSTNYDFF